MGLPQTLAGIVGLILVVGYLTSLILHGDDASGTTLILVGDLKNSTSENLNASESSSGMSGFFTSLLSVITLIWNSIKLILISIVSFLEIPFQEDTPVEVFMVFALVYIGAILAIIKILWSGE